MIPSTENASAHEKTIINIFREFDYQYADDVMIATKIRHHRIHTGEDMAKFQLAIDAVSKWADENMLKINYTKTKVIQFEKRDADRDSEELYLINDHPIENVETLKYLGIIFDRKLNFAMQANCVESRAMKSVNAAARLSNYMQHRSLNTTLYNIYVDPIVHYAATSWYTNYQNLRIKVEYGHHRTTRCALGVPYRTDVPGYLTYEERCKKLNIPTVVQRSTYLTAIMVSKIITKKIECGLRQRIVESMEEGTSRRRAANNPRFNLYQSRIDKTSPLGRMMSIANQYLSEIDFHEHHLPEVKRIAKAKIYTENPPRLN